MKSFDRAARNYDRFSFIQREMAEWLAEWLPHERSGIAVEAGAGTGVFTQHLMPWTDNLIATDASPAMVANGEARVPGANWKIALAEDLPNVSAKWICSASFLQWAENPVNLLRHWKSSLTPGGRILAGLFAAPTLSELYEILPKGTAPLQWRAPEEWEASIRDAGLKLVRAQAIERVFTFPSCLELLRTLHGIGAAPRRRIPPAVLRSAIRQYNTHFATKNGVHSTWTFYRFEAERGD